MTTFVFDVTIFSLTSVFDLRNNNEDILSNTYSPRLTVFTHHRFPVLVRSFRYLYLCTGGRGGGSKRHTDMSIVLLSKASPESRRDRALPVTEIMVQTAGQPMEARCV